MSPGTDSGINVTWYHPLGLALHVIAMQTNGSHRAEGWTCREEGSLRGQEGVRRAQSGGIRLSMSDATDSESGPPPQTFGACHLPAVVGMDPTWV